MELFCPICEKQIDLNKIEPSIELLMAGKPIRLVNFNCYKCNKTIVSIHEYNQQYLSLHNKVYIDKEIYAYDKYNGKLIKVKGYKIDESSGSFGVIHE